MLLWESIPKGLAFFSVKAIPAALKKAGLALGDIDLIELNAGVCRPVYCLPNRTSVWTAQRSMFTEERSPSGILWPQRAQSCFATLLYAMRQRNVTLGAVSLCIGGGNGVAAIVERLN